MMRKKTKATPKPAILPGNNKDPTGIDSLERRAIKDFARRMKKISRFYISALDRIPARLAVNAYYEYQLDPLLLSMVLDDASLLVDSVLLEGGQNSNWFAQTYVEVAVIRGTAQAFANLSQQSPAYLADRESLQELLLSDPYQRRMALVYARTFEEMKGLSAETKRNMARILTEGIGRGLNPKVVAVNLRKQAGIEIRRASTIARTEMTMALRRARWDEADEAMKTLGLNIRLLHFSALSPTTRQTHAARHAHIYTVEEVRTWYATGANAINCKCSQVEVLVDSKGIPLNPKVVELARKEYQQWKGLAANSLCCHQHSHAA
ncbi:phage head morphogenesis protein [Superficieibacter electus]|uniref:Phage head morphogenesis protein n=1 Tax=Superficieibacter electus TaxID=2022662 RepID=A0A2P5GQL2_9ENTR|nr:phage minor head protein [Superficieibacter electus]POP43354.1 phage head morphogenesis protein [Superficieibacter electus]POP48871.1 phage head morphogenesis protein [Superficieibacter electus]